MGIVANIFAGGLFVAAGVLCGRGLLELWRLARGLSFSAVVKIAAAAAALYVLGDAVIGLAVEWVVGNG